MTNGWPTLADGLTKRPPTELVAKLQDDDPTFDAFCHTINRDASEQYIAIVIGGEIKVFDMFTGANATVTAPDGWDYLDGITDTDDISMTTVADYTFVVNRKKVCALANAGVDATPDPDYYLYINRDFGVDPYGSPYGPGMAYQYDPNPYGGSFVGSVQRFDKLPETPSEGAIYKVTGDDNTGFVSYYVRYSGGVWNETVEPGLANAIDAKTMPHALVRQADGSFTFAPFSWAPRRVGDQTTNPNPGFIGRGIRKVFFYQNRLAFLYDENTVLSCAGDFGNFWRMTVLDYIDSDVVDIAASSTKVSILADAAPFADGILLTSDQTQFSLTNGELGVSPASMAIRPTTNYNVNPKAGLAALGSDVYFAVERNGFAAIREYSRLSGGEATSAADVTAHVPRYIPGGVHQIIPADDLNCLFVLTKGKEWSIYVYNFYWASGEEKLQSAWHEWFFAVGVRVISASYLRGYLYVVVRRADGIYLERFDLQNGARPSSTSNQVFLDRRAEITGTYLSGSNQTEFQLPCSPTPATWQIIRGDAHSQPQTLIDPATYQWVAPDRIRVPGNETAGPVVVGRTYLFTFTFSSFFPRKADGTAVTSGRTQVRTLFLNFRDTGYFKTEVSPYGFNPVTEEVLPGKLNETTGKTLGSNDFKLNRPLYAKGVYPIQVFGQNTQAKITISNLTHVACVFTGGEWEAFYNNRARA